MSFRIIAPIAGRGAANNNLDPNAGPNANPGQVPPPAQQQRRRRPRPGERAPLQPGA
ncbi:hypothetical protein ACIPSE_00730 [Streptomyces sp. NPDC090106]|uniref:hypothetical protein n=1 Tax=Streptomyces sp. NPDC090106 TaxID=3365946 RepID=UPI003826C3E8